MQDRTDIAVGYKKEISYALSIVNRINDPTWLTLNGRVLCYIMRKQWRRQIIKLGSTFKGQLYFQVGQMEGPTVPRYSREAQNAEWVGLRRGTVAPLH